MRVHGLLMGLLLVTAGCAKDQAPPPDGGGGPPPPVPAASDDWAGREAECNATADDVYKQRCLQRLSADKARAAAAKAKP